MKIYIAAAAVPLADYYGFYSLRMIPFFKATGGNEIDVVVNSARAVQCWFWGSPNGQGFAYLDTNVMQAAFLLATSKYTSPHSLAQLCFVVCKLGTAAGTATTGDVVVIPNTQT
jgi:hypothetical protein